MNLFQIVPVDVGFDPFGQFDDQVIKGRFPDQSVG